MSDSANPPSVPTLDVEAARTLLTYYVDDIEDDPMLDGLEIEGIDVAATFRALSVFLRDELTELRKDRERLNLVESLSRPRVDTRPRSSFSQGDVSWDGRTFTWTAPGPAMYSTLRAAIDSVARSVHPSETAPDECDENCERCSGEYCERHGTDPCECDVIDRHTRETEDTNDGQ